MSGLAEGAMLRSGAGVTVIGGGAVLAGELEAALAIAPALVAADGGADRALALGRVPDLVLGDLDSLSDAARLRIPAGRIHLIAEQDSTDFTKCLRRIDAPFVLAVGFAGLRLDHTLAALSAMAAGGAMPVSMPKSMPVILLAAEDVVFLAPPRLDLDLPPGTRLSLWPMGPARGRSTGLEWPIDGLEFAPAARVGTSNRVVGPVTLCIEGQMLVLLPRTCLAAALDGLGLSRDGA